jgi:hypothetical protein
MDIWLIFQNFCMYACSDESFSSFLAMDMFEKRAKVPRKGAMISM